jgi:hypothetical protein
MVARTARNRFIDPSLLAVPSKVGSTCILDSGYLPAH